MKKRTTATTKNRIACAIAWCVALAESESQHCAAHRANVSVHPQMLTAADTDPLAVASDCAWCNGTRECDDCDGDGTHQCERSGCYDEHDCGACDGTGDCPYCGPNYDDNDEPLEWNTKYLLWANDPGWQPWKRSQPWDEA